MTCDVCGESKIHGPTCGYVGSPVGPIATGIPLGKPPSWISRKFSEDEIRQIIREEIRGADQPAGKQT